MADRDSLRDKEKDLEWVLKFDEMLRSEAERFGLPRIDLEKNDRDLASVLGALGLS